MAEKERIHYKFEFDAKPFPPDYEHIRVMPVSALFSDKGYWGELWEYSKSMFSRPQEADSE